MEYFIRKAEKNDLPVIEAIYAGARKFMAEHRNPTQWGEGYPARSLLEQDIEKEKLYLVCDAAGIHGVFYFAVEADPTYAVIRDGNWHSDQPYGVIHRIAGDGSGGILRTAVLFAFEQAGYLRIDTHEDNYVMQNALHRMGFERCGIIYIEDGSPRIAFDYIVAV